MGDPKYPRRVWRKPKRPLNYDLKMEELKTLGTFGLKTKRELWKAHTELSRVRHQARSLLALGQDIRTKKEPILLKSLARIGLVGDNATLDDVLNLQITDLLSRRLQTVILKKLSFKTPYQARQAIVHRHIMIGNRIVNIPSYTVKIEEEDQIHLTSESSLKNQLEKTSNTERDSPPPSSPSASSPPQQEQSQAQPETKPEPSPPSPSDKQPPQSETETDSPSPLPEQPEVQKSSTDQSQD